MRFTWCWKWFFAIMLKHICVNPAFKNLWTEICIYIYTHTYIVSIRTIFSCDILRYDQTSNIKQISAKIFVYTSYFNDIPPFNGTIRGYGTNSTTIVHNRIAVYNFSGGRVHHDAQINQLLRYIGISPYF
jgi:hypothetical protein